MILRQFLHQDSVGISCLIGCGGRGNAAVIAPAVAVEPYLQAAEAGGTSRGRSDPHLSLFRRFDP